jgi:hypothetical protein
VRRSKVGAVAPLEWFSAFDCKDQVYTVVWGYEDTYIVEYIVV